MNSKPENQENQDKNENLLKFCQKNGCLGGLSKITRNVTIEPVIFLCIFSALLSEVPTQFLMYEKVCHSEQGYSHEICNQILFNESYKEQKQVLQNDASNWMMITMGVGIIPSIIFKIVAGSWSDKYGRKPILFLAILSIILRYIGLVINVGFPDSRYYWMLLANVPTSIIDYTIILPISFAYISDITHDKNRSRRFLSVQWTMFFGITSGSFSSAAIHDTYGYYAVYGISIATCTFALVYLMFFVEETCGGHKKTIKDHLVPFKDFFNFKNLKDCCKILFVKRAGNRRLHLCLLIAAFISDAILRNCHGAVDKFFTQLMYNWTTTESAKAFGFILMANVALFAIVGYFVMNHLHANELLSAFIGFLSASIGYIICAFAKYTWMFYLGKIVSFLEFFPEVIIQTNLTKAVLEDEIGKVMTLISVFGALTGPETNMMFIVIYKATKSFFSGFSYLLASILYIVPLLMFIIMHFKPMDSNQKVVTNLKTCEEQIKSSKLDVSEIKPWMRCRTI